MSRGGQMTSYTPVALGAVCNDGLAVLGAGARMQLGPRRTLLAREQAE